MKNVNRIFRVRWNGILCILNNAMAESVDDTIV